MKVYIVRSRENTDIFSVFSNHLKAEEFIRNAQITFPFYTFYIKNYEIDID